MKKLLVALAWFSLFCIPAFAQDVPQVEAYGGYQLFHDGGASEYGANESNYHGFIAAFEGNIKSYFGIVGELGFNKHSEVSEVADSWKNVSFLFGPRFGYRDEKYRIFIHYLVGSFRTSIDGNDGLNQHFTNFGQDIGMGIDLVINDRISVRPFQMDLLSIRASADRFSLWSNHFRYSGGVVFKFGSK